MALHSRQLDSERTDADLSRRAIAGNTDAFEALYRRHADAAWRVAHAVASSREDAGDAVADAFTRMLQALAEGRLRPDVDFRPQLLATTRNAAIDQYRYRAQAPEPAEPPAPAEGADAGLLAEEFRALPERWRSILWLTEVEGMAVSDVGERLGLSAAGAAQLARRARIGLRERYLQAQPMGAPVGAACATTLAGLGAFADGGLTPRATARIDQHLAGCDVCTARAAELSDLGERLRATAPAAPAGLAALAFARYRSAFDPADRSRKGLLMLGDTDLTRPLAVVTTSLLALGVIAAGLMSNGGVPSAVAGARSGGTVANTPTILAQLASSGGGAPTAAPTTSGAGTGLSLALSLGAAGAATAPAGGSASTTTPTTIPSTGPGGLVIPPTVPPATPPTPGGSPTGTDALLQIELGANVGPVSTSGSLGVGGGCTGVSISKSTSCAPAAPSSAGVNVGLASPLGQIIVDVPTGAVSPPATTTPPTTAAPMAKTHKAAALAAKVAGISLSA